ncbi:phage terminase GpA [Candidatus Koribacter versatilis Ellin345]|uniref:Phage terminase GpA n=1 Tax=Koribacter versatilis (strain Ellin345) TaxID=204669 RepID=Q1ILS3_KORVE|nr:phage terminase large subunit family protein [Candidatus Koribacter versatilis]ABF42177.1 phage terminase GpA [Candidatus Koribacter versatilis Ellin345]
MTSAPIIATQDPVLAVFQEAAQVFRPAPALTITEWAERHRILSTESSVSAGLYRCEVTPYAREMQDAIKDPDVEEVVFWTAAQMGKSTSQENIAAYFICEDPCPIIWMWPTKEVARDWSVDTLDPLLRDSPELSRRFTEGSRKSSNRGLFKKFPGGYLSAIGANSASGLRRRRARLLICDEIDGNPPSAGDEGDPIEIVISRAETFWNRKRVLASTCTNKGESRIEGRYEISSKGKYWVPCTSCGELMLLSFRGLKWPKGEEPTIENTYLPCEHCGVVLTEADKPAMLAAGRWIHEHPERKIRGYWINKMYSPFVAWWELAAKFKRLNARTTEDREALKPFVNLDLAETWEVKDEKPDRNRLVDRRETYEILREQREEGAPASQSKLVQVSLLPDSVTVLTCSVDVQVDRLEFEIVGWGHKRESWSIYVGNVPGDPKNEAVWLRLDQILQMELQHHRGSMLPIAATFVDSGFDAPEVYNFTKPRAYRWVFASKGSSEFNHVPLAKKKHIDRSNVWLYQVGVGQIKKTIYANLMVTAPGPAYMHFTTAHNTPEYFDQLTAETLESYYEHGFPRKRWKKQPGARNEALDLRVYNYAAFLSLSEQPDKLLDRLREQLLLDAKKLEDAGAKENQLPLISTELPPSTPPEPVDRAEATAATAEKLAETLTAALAPPPVVAPPSESFTPRVKVKRSSWL